MVKLLLLTVLLLNIGVNGRLWIEEFKCELNVPYVENECNRCRCLKEGTQELGCTMKYCGQNPELTNCMVNTVWRNKCNRCWCVKGMGTVCTDKNCDS